MDIKLIRETFTDKSTIGRLLIDGLFYGWTLEDTDRRLEEDVNRKIKGKTAIPTGRYRVIITWSPRFKRDLPLLVDVPGFDGIRIHSGNTPNDTEGCILVGKTKGNDFVGQSRVAFNEVFSAIQSALDQNEDVFITIERQNEQIS